MDKGFDRRITPLYVEMPTAEDRLEMLRRYFLRQPSYITTEGMKKIADLLQGACFDDINNFLSTVETLNGAKMTADSTHFRKTYSEEDDSQEWCACLQNDPRGEAASCQGKVCVGMPITPRDISKAYYGTNKCKPFKRTVQEEDLELFEQYYKDGKHAVKVNNKNNSDEIVPDHQITSGKFRDENRIKGSMTGYQYYDI